MNLEVSFSQEPLLLVADDKFSNQSMLALIKSKRILFGNQIPVNIVNNEDERLDWVSAYISNLVKEREILFLVVQQNFIGRDTGIRLISHLRLSEDKKINRLPIIILTDKEIDKLVPKSQSAWEKIAPLFSLGVRSTPEQDKEKRYAKNDSLLIQEIEKLHTELTKDGKNEVNLDQFTEYENPEIPIGKPTASSHQVTNDWGAYRLIQAAGLPPKHTYPKHLYFKYLQRSAVEPYPIDKKTFEAKISRNIRILLIDDNHDKGWKTSIELILNECLLVDGCSATVDTQDYADEIDLLLLKSENGNCLIDDYDLVYLDLRLPENSVSRVNPTPENGKVVLGKIKRHNPTIQVIMFTASTKATNMDDLYEMGVDGYFVKESPETRNDPDFSKSNLEGFVKTTRNCLEKGALLQPYWKRIEEIKKNNLINGNERDIDGVKTKFEERIIERLKMFVGLLKKAYEQTKFDRDKFLYDEYETAFLTLWSCLNELQNFHFTRQKIAFPVGIYGEQSSLNRHPNGARSILDSCVSWKINIDSSFYINYLVSYNSSDAVVESRPGYAELKPYSNFKQIAVRNPITKKWEDCYPYFEFGILQEISSKEVDIYKQKLSLNVAFIINQLRPLNKEAIFGNLVRINHARNHLHLTHGDEENDDFTLTMKEVERFDKQNIDNLFKIIFLLVTGKYIETV